MAINQLRALGVLRFVPFKPKSHLAAMRAAKLAGDNAAAALAAATPTAPSETRADPGELLATLRAEIADDFAPVVPKAPNSSTASTTATKPKKKKAKKMKTKTKAKKKSKTTKTSQPASASKPTIVCHATFGEGKNYWAGESEEHEA
jgi:outer membrane biosynthesis protein TonB